MIVATQPKPTPSSVQHFAETCGEGVDYKYGFTPYSCWVVPDQTYIENMADIVEFAVRRLNIKSGSFALRFPNHKDAYEMSPPTWGRKVAYRYDGNSEGNSRERVYFCELYHADPETMTAIYRLAHVEDREADEWHVQGFEVIDD